jgi:hypothetical protein
MKGAPTGGRRPYICDQIRQRQQSGWGDSAIAVVENLAALFKFPRPNKL